MKSQKQNFSPILALTIVLAIPLGLSAQYQQPAPAFHHYTVTDLGTLGGTFSYAIGLNNHGWADGAGTLPGDTARRAVLWLQKQKIELGTFGGPNSAVFGPGLNERGQVVGEAETNTSDPLNQNFCGFGTGLICLPFIWQDGVMTPLPLLGGYNGNTYAVNNRGVVAGQAQASTIDPTCSSAYQETFPVLWVNTEVQQLPIFPGEDQGSAFAINDPGQAVGGLGTCPDFGSIHAVLWENGRVTDLGSLGGSFGNSATGINNRGQVVGTSDLPGDNTAHAFLWTRQTGIQDLGTLPGDVASNAGNINDSTQVVGASIDMNGNCRAFVWQRGVMTDLNTLIPPGSPLFLCQAYNINARGQIVGLGFTSNGDTHAFLATPCDEHHPGIDGCDYSLVDASVASRVSPVPANQPPATLTPGSHIPEGMLNRFRSRWSQRNQGLGTGAALQKQEPPVSTVTDDWLGDHLGDFRCGPRGCRHYGYCEVMYGKLDGECVGHNLQFCDIQPSGNCPIGQPASSTLDSCGPFGSDTVALNYPCSF